jgi:hypothetical protein
MNVVFLFRMVISPESEVSKETAMSSRAGALAGALCAIASFVVPGAVTATVFPPAQINYQGVLRGPAEEPLTGTYDMTFRFFDADTGGNEILIDRHIAATGKEVIVDGGLFSVELGGGLGVVDGSGPGNYTSLMQVFRDFPSVWLEVTVGSETLAPRTRVLAAGYALNAASAGSADVAASATSAVTAGNATNLNGQPASFYLDTGSTRQTKSGAVRFQSGAAGVYTVQADMLPGGQGAILAQGPAGFCELGSAAEGAYCGGTNYGGFFYDSNEPSSYAYLGFSSYGVYANGSTGVYSSGGTTGLYADGPIAARFVQSNATENNVNICYSGYGVLSRSVNGIYNLDVDDNSYAYLGQGAYKVRGSGTVSFVQNDPGHADRVVVYHAPESSEVNVYTRGSAKLENGVAHIALDPTFGWTANPDLGLTAHLTPRGQPVPLAVDAVSATELSVRGPAGSDVAFDYQVMGLRIGFEEMPAVTPKERDSVIPRSADGGEVYAAHPELRPFNALERYKTIERAVGRDVDPDLRATAALRNRIGVGRPIRVADDEAADAVRPLQGSAGNGPGDPATPAPPVSSAAARPGAASDGRPAVPGAPSGDAGHPMSQRFPAASVIETGDVLVLDPASPGAVRRSDREADAAVVGVALGPAVAGQVDVAVGLVATVRADAGYGAIRAGDLLVSSPAPGAAMRAGSAPPGTLLGKAIDPLESGLGTIRILVVLR